MPVHGATIIGASGTPYAVPGLDYVAVRTLVLEKVINGLPEGVTKGPGNPPAWIQFAPPATDWALDQGGGPGTGNTFSIRPDGVEAVQPA